MKMARSVSLCGGKKRNLWVIYMSAVIKKISQFSLQSSLCPCKPNKSTESINCCFENRCVCYLSSKYPEVTFSYKYSHMVCAFHADLEAAVHPSTSQEQRLRNSDSSTELCVGFLQLLEGRL